MFWLKPLLKGKGVRRQFPGPDTPASFLNLDVMLCKEEEGAWSLMALQVGATFLWTSC